MGPHSVTLQTSNSMYRGPWANRPKTPDRREGCAQRWQGGPLESSSSAPTELIVPGWRFCISGTWSQNCTCSKSGWWLALPRIVPCETRMAPTGNLPTVIHLLLGDL